MAAASLMYVCIYTVYMYTIHCVAMCMAILMQYAIIVNYNWEFNLYNDNALKYPTVIQSCKMYIRYTPSIILYISSNTLQAHTITHLYITILIIFMLYIRSMVRKCFNVYNCTVKSIKGKEAPPAG